MKKASRKSKPENLAKTRPALRVLFIFDRKRRGGQYRSFELSLQSLLRQGADVHLLSTGSIKLESHENLRTHLLQVPTRSQFGFWYFFWFRLLLPVKFLLVYMQVRPQAVITFNPIDALNVKFPALLTVTPTLLLLRALPWKSFIGRPFMQRSFGLLFSPLGVFSATRVVVPTRTMKRELTKRYPFIREKVIPVRFPVVYPHQLISKDAAAKPLEKPLTDEELEGRVESSTHEAEAVSIFDQEKMDKWLAAFAQRKRKVAKRYNLSEKQIILVTTGELTKDRNIVPLVRALGAADDERIALIICGEGPERQTIRTIAISLGLEHNVVFAGWLEKPQEVMSGCDLYLVPRLESGVSHSMLEALGLGVGVLAADSPSTREILNRTDLYFEAEHVGKLASKLTEILTKKGELERLQRISQEKARELSFNWGDALTTVLTEHLLKK